MSPSNDLFDCGRTIPCLTIHGPWAWAIMAGIKPLENRTWATHYRGPLAIHAGLSEASEAEALETLTALGYADQIPQDWPRGVLLGIVDLVAVTPPDAADERTAAQASSPFAAGPVVWHLENPRRLATPLPCRGQQGLFQVDPSGWTFAE